MKVLAVDDAPLPVRNDGSIYTVAARVPYSDLASTEAKQNFRELVNSSERFVRAWSALEAPSVSDTRALQDAMLLRPGVQRLRESFPVSVEPAALAGIQVDIVTPLGGVPSLNQDCVLINLHGGGFVGGARYGGQQESIPVASLGGFKVVTVDYRMAPENRFPAATEDVAAVYLELLRHYDPTRIGIYGASSGAYLTGQCLAWFQKQGLPTPGAVGLFGGGLHSGKFGDSQFLGSLFCGIPLTEGHIQNPSHDPRSYFYGSDLSDPLVSPSESQEVLRMFPPSLLISGTRDTNLSGTVHAHTQLVKAGVDARLHVWEGVAHCWFAQNIVDPTVPETREAWDVIIRFFQRTLRA